jgi:hypothetical protein
MHFGRHRDAVEILKDHPTFTAKIIAAPASPGYALDYVFTVTFLCMNYYFHGLNELVHVTFKLLDLTFDTIDEILVRLTEVSWCMVCVAPQYWIVDRCGSNGCWPSKRHHIAKLASCLFAASLITISCFWLLKVQPYFTSMEQRHSKSNVQMSVKRISWQMKALMCLSSPPGLDHVRVSADLASYGLDLDCTMCMIRRCAVSGWSRNRMSTPSPTNLLTHLARALSPPPPLSLSLTGRKAKAKEWLKSLPDDQTFYEYSMTMPAYDHGALFGSHQTCWIALAHEKYGLHEGALRFADLALEPDMMKAGTPDIRWTLVISFACKGRVLAQLKRHTEALTAFQAAVSVSMDSYRMMAPLALQELGRYVDTRSLALLEEREETDGGERVAAVEQAAEYALIRAQAEKDLETKLAEFGEWITKDEFAMLTITP